MGHADLHPAIHDRPPGNAGKNVGPKRPLCLAISRRSVYISMCKNLCAIGHHLILLSTASCAVVSGLLLFDAMLEVCPRGPAAFEEVKIEEHDLLV